MKTAFIVCARTNSSRVSKKILKYINGKPLIEHLIDRLINTGIQVIIAIPIEDQNELRPLLKDKPIYWYHGENEDPLARMSKAADHYDIENIIRVTHDKIFIEPEMIYNALARFVDHGHDYLFGTGFTDGTAFEIINKELLNKAHRKFKNIEHISYAVKKLSKKPFVFNVPIKFSYKNARLLLDFEEDFTLMETIMSVLGNDSTLEQVLNWYIHNEEWCQRLNRLPLVTFYTCAFNAEKFIQKCMESVASQTVFFRSEYIIIDDFSDDSTFELMAKFKAHAPNIKIYRNPKNVGLATSSNIALKMARGKYIIRLDADDYFLEEGAVTKMINCLDESHYDVVYPAYLKGSIDTEDYYMAGHQEHHIGGSLFRTKAINAVKFTEGLRGYEGLDFWYRATDHLDVCYYDEPLFYYLQHGKSLSKNNLEERAKIKSDIEEQHGEKTARS